MPTIRKPLDTLTKPLPAAIKPAGNDFIGDVLDCSPNTDQPASREFHSAAKEGSQSVKGRPEAPRDFSNYQHPPF